MSLTSEQIRQGRLSVGWSRLRLSAKAGVSENNLRDFEKGLRRLSVDEIGAIRVALEAAGVIFAVASGNIAT
jgi:transcriptional regulator with XRE-family HTH domain